MSVPIRLQYANFKWRLSNSEKSSLAGHMCPFERNKLFLPVHVEELQHRTPLQAISASHTCCPKWYIKLPKSIKNGRRKGKNVAHNFHLGNIKILWKLQSCHINSSAIIFQKKMLRGCVNSDRINAGVWQALQYTKQNSTK